MGRGHYQEERGQPPPKGNWREPWREEPGQDRGPRREQRGGATQALEEEDGGVATPEMNVLCEVDSDGEEGIFRLWEVGDISNEEATTAFSSDEEEGDEEEEGPEEARGVHILAAAGNLRPGPAYVWGHLGGRAEYVKILIDSGNAVGDLVSEEFAKRMGLDGDEVQDHIAVPTAATATTVLVVRRCREMTTKLDRIEGEFTIRPLVVRGLTHPVNLGQHVLGRHWCSLDVTAGCTQLGVWGKSVQLVGRQTGWAPWADGGRQPGGRGDSPPPMGKSTRSRPPPLVPVPGTPRKEGELCPLEAMLRGVGAPESWLIDCSPPPVTWELPPPLE